MRFRLIGVAAMICLAGMPPAVKAQPASPPDASGSTFFERFVHEYQIGFNPPPGTTEPAPVPSVCLQGPLDSPPFPSSNFSFGGNPGMCQDGTADRGPLIKALGPTSVGQWLDANRISLYGWIEPGFDFSSSSHTKQGNAPAAYDFNANAPFLNQATFYIDRLPDTIQDDHIDWGFRITNIYGTDYRYTTMYGFDSSQLLEYNKWAGWDAPMIYGDIYVPWIVNGMNIRFGRYISLPDIEAQLAPDNYFYSHSILYSTDPYTQIGVVTTTKLDPKGQWNIQFGISAGNDVAAWAGHHLVQPTFTGTSSTIRNSIPRPKPGTCSRIRPRTRREHRVSVLRREWPVWRVLQYRHPLPVARVGNPELHDVRDRQTQRRRHPQRILRRQERPAHRLQNRLL